MMTSFSRIVLTGCLIAATTPAMAATEQDIRGWLNKTVPVILMNDPAQPGMMDSKRAFFTPEGFNGFVKTIERQGTGQLARQVAAVCIAQARIAEGGTWIVDTQVVYKNQQALIQPIEAPADKTAPPKAKPNPYSYETAQFYIKDVATANDVKVNQYIPEQAPKEGFANCRAPGEVQERMSGIDEQLAFYESTLATLQERIAALRAQKASMTGAAPMPGQVVPPAPQQIAPAPIAAPHMQPTPTLPQQVMPPAAQPIPQQAPVPTNSIDANAAEHVLRAPAGAVPVAPAQQQYIAPQQQPTVAPQTAPYARQYNTHSTLQETR